MITDRQRAYWRRNRAYILALLAAWASASYGAAILFADALDGATVLGFPLGFFFATEGALAVFVALVFLYVKLMNDLDRKFGAYER